MSKRRWQAGVALGLLASAGIAVAVPTDPEVVELLSGINFAPSRLTIDSVLGSEAPNELIRIASDPDFTTDPGVRIRALRALVSYKDTNKAEVANTLQNTVARYSSESQGYGVLFLRVSILSLAEVDEELSAVNLIPFLNHNSRDIRAASAQALGMGGSPQAVQPLRDRALIETELQVQLAISDALFELD